MMKRISRIAVLMAVLTAMGGVQAAQAEAPSMTDSDGASATVRVLNNYRSAVRIFVSDSEGTTRLLGRVPRSGLQTFDLPEDLVSEGASFEIMAYPVELPTGSETTDSGYPGVKTASITVGAGQVIDFWLEHDLSSSTARIGAL